MAKKSQVIRDERRSGLIKKFFARRAELRSRLKDPSIPVEDKLKIQADFAKLPRNSCLTRRNIRCKISGRSLGVYRKFQLSRIALRELALEGKLPGMRKSSW